EGWSCIGGWRGPPLSAVLDRVGLQPQARFIVFHCADEVLRYIDGSESYYESIDLIDAFHPQTILPTNSTVSRCPSPMARRCGSAWSGNSATRWRNSSPASKRWTASTTSKAATADIGKTPATNGMRES